MSTHSRVAFDGEAIGLSQFAFGAIAAWEDYSLEIVRCLAWHCLLFVKYLTRFVSKRPKAHLLRRAESENGTRTPPLIQALQGAF